MLLRSMQFLNLLLLICFVWQLEAKLTDIADVHYVEKITRYAKSAEMRNYLNASCDPCENFYNFACGNYQTLNEPYLPPYKNNAFQTIAKALQRKFSFLLTTENDTDTSADKKVKDFYKSCLAMKTTKITYGSKLKEIISEFGQMPVLEGAEWRADDFDWLQTVAEIKHKYGVRIILGIGVGVDVVNNTMNRLRIQFQDLPLESATIYKENEHATFRHHRKMVMAKNLKNFFGLEWKLAQETINEIFEFEIKLFSENAEKDPNNKEDNGDDKEEEDDNDDDDDEKYSALLQNVTTIEDLQAKYYPQLDVELLLNISLSGLYQPSDQICDLIEDDFKRVYKVLQETPKRIVANYIFYYLLENFMLSINKNNQNKTCVEEAKEHFAKVLDNMVYRQITTRQTERDVKYMWQTIKAAFHSTLTSNKLSWMNEETRQLAIEKLSSMKMEINSYENINLPKEFEQLAVNQHDYMENIKAILEFKALKEREKLTQPAVTYDNAATLSFTPVYVLTENIIKVPVAILQPYYLWSDYYPNALKFGTLGFLMSHELIHGFDAEGRFFDKTGNLRMWWDKQSSEYFQNNTDCFSNQYHGFRQNGRLLPAAETQSENIADNGGIRLAYEAYLKWYEDALRSYEKLDTETLPRLNYTSRQMFFISFGQLWCSASHDILLSLAASTDDHAPDKFRVIGPLQNLKEFSVDFNCPRGSPMNPIKKCIIY